MKQHVATQHTQHSAPLFHATAIPYDKVLQPHGDTMIKPRTALHRKDMLSLIYDKQVQLAPIKLILPHLGSYLHQEAPGDSLQQQGRGIGVQPWQEGGLEVGALDVHQACAASAGEGECQVCMVGLLPVCLHSNQVRSTLQCTPSECDKGYDITCPCVDAAPSTSLLTHANTTLCKSRTHTLSACT